VCAAHQGDSIPRSLARRGWPSSSACRPLRAGHELVDLHRTLPSLYFAERIFVDDLAPGSFITCNEIGRTPRSLVFRLGLQLSLVQYQ
jgi:hypothetical protein